MSGAHLDDLQPRIVQTADVTRISTTFNDIAGHPIITLTLELPREITATGQATVRYASFYLIGVAVLVVALLAYVLHRIVLSPLARMTRHAVAIGRDEDLTTRLGFSRRDEIGVLAREFDRMVAFAFFDAPMNTVALHRFTIEDRLRGALGRQFSLAEFPDRVAAILQETGLPAAACRARCGSRSLLKVSRISRSCYSCNSMSVTKPKASS